MHVIFQVSQLVPGRSTLFVSYCKPHAAVTSKTMSRWVVTLLSDAGVDTSILRLMHHVQQHLAFMLNSYLV